MLNIKKIASYSMDENMVIVTDKNKQIPDFNFTKPETDFIHKEIERNESLVILNRFTNWIFIQTTDYSKDINVQKELLRKSGNTICKFVQENKIGHITIIDAVKDGRLTLSLFEGLALGNYQFIKYFKNAAEKKTSLTEISLFSDDITGADIQILSALIEGVYFARDLVNEPASLLNSVKFSQEIAEMGKKSGFKTEIFDKQKIKDLKMGGLLAVNKGSADPPTFTVLEWKPQNAVNKKPYILVGKGIVYDTGGLSLKPTHDSMDYMKCDMAGGATVAAVFMALARTKVPVYAIGLIPSTDNRLGPDAYSPGDVITISDGTTVEVLNTDAEGRLILADAICYANRFEPELIIDIATLTGAAHRAIGTQGMVGMGNASKNVVDLLVETGLNEHERIAVFPFWEEYGESIKSEIADIQNVGGDNAGAITAGKFLEYFTKYPYFHLDIAGTAFLKKGESYRGTGATGSGVRLLYRFLQAISNEKIR
jgi:leucyl aminopeptidase